MHVNRIGEPQCRWPHQLWTRMAHPHSVRFDRQIRMIPVNCAFGHLDLVDQRKRILARLLFRGEFRSNSQPRPLRDRFG